MYCRCVHYAWFALLLDKKFKVFLWYWLIICYCHYCCHSLIQIILLLIYSCPKKNLIKFKITFLEIIKNAKDVYILIDISLNILSI